MPEEKVLSVKAVYKVLVDVLYGANPGSEGRSSIAYALGLISDAQNAKGEFTKLGFKDSLDYARQVDAWVGAAGDRGLTQEECAKCLRKLRIGALSVAEKKDLLETIYIAGGDLQETREILRAGIPTDRMNLSFNRGSRKGRTN